MANEKPGGFCIDQYSVLTDQKGRRDAEMWEEEEYGSLCTLSL